MQIEKAIRNDNEPLNSPVLSSIKLNWEILIFTLILIAGFLTRFYDLEKRVMSHDENSHVYFSWLLSNGDGYAHDPVTHGPLQFHLVAFSYFLFGDNDLTARIPAALFSIATIAFAWAYRRYLGPFGALFAAVMLLLSPFILYYGRYVRNEAFVGLFFMINLWAILRYLDTGQFKYMIWLTASLSLHFATKETSFIYAAQTLLFLGLFFIYRITQTSWDNRQAQKIFLISLMVGILLFGTAFVFLISESAPTIEETEEPAPSAMFSSNPAASILIAVSVLFVIVSLVFLISGYGVKALREERSFSLMLVVFTIIIPQLSPFGMNFLGINIPVNATQVNNLQPTDIWQMSLVFVPFLAIPILVGLWWNPKKWLINAGVFYGIFLILFTTFFTNGAGFFTGLVGSLGYWLAQQAVERGSQPFYYYFLIQVPLYEYLPAFGVLISVIVFGINSFSRKIDFNSDSSDTIPEPNNAAPVFALLSFWTVSSILAYTIAGEKMPWLTFHIALPMILCSAWGFGKLTENFNWGIFNDHSGWIILLITPIFFSSAAVAFGALTGTTPPFQGQSLEQLSHTATFLVAFIAVIASLLGLTYLMRQWRLGQLLTFFTLFVTAFLTLLTTRTAFRAAYINYDNATEYLVYAHSAPGVKTALTEIESLSKRLTGTLDLAVAYDNETTYPYWWYLRNYPKQRYFGGNPTRDLRESPVILVGDANYAKIEPILGNSYNRFDYIRIWWPNQDYYDLTWERIFNAIKDPEMRTAIFEVWLNRDYTRYAQITGNDMSLSNWYPSGRMRLYIRKDIANQIWEYGAGAEIVTEPDPLEGKEVQIFADKTIGSEGVNPGEFKKPRGIAIAPDGTIYVADTENHRIQHVTPEGTVLNVWGRFGDLTQGEAPGGTFYEPWSIAVDSAGFVYVCDTWNHRIQKFTSDGQFVLMWGFFGQADDPYAFWGPRGITIDQQDRIYITDTGNKRVVVFNSDGSFITEFGLSGFLPGEFNEPVGLDISRDGEMFIADTWNQRIQVMKLDSSNTFQPDRAWDIHGWFGQSLDNKPYIAVAQNGHVFTTDPENFRIFEYQPDGELVRYWGMFGTGLDGLNLPIGIAVDTENNLWVADSGNHRIIRFQVP